MENLNEKIDAFDKATQTVQKRPWAAIIVILVIYSYVLYKTGEWSSREQIATLKADKEACQRDYWELTNELLIKNNVIDRKEREISQRDELIKYADSTVQKIQETQHKTKKR